MATYAAVNGKAPSGLKAGDSVVTNGGTYTITGVKSDGTYTSTKTSDTTKYTYTGTYAAAPSASASSSSGAASSSSASRTSTAASSSSSSGASRSSSGSSSSSSSSSSASTASKVYRVGEGGKAPAGLKAGDQVVTGGGTYTISAVNPDGSYQSRLTNGNQTIHNYTGSYAAAPSASGSSSSSSSSGSSGSTGSTAPRVLNSVGGQAPAGARVGDYIVTNGGTYQITGGTAGNWTSKKVSDATQYTGFDPASLVTPGSGAVAGVSVLTQQQQAIKDEMAANSLAWHSAATQEEKNELHRRNLALAQQLERLGVSMSYDPATGIWTGGTPETADSDGRPSLSTYQRSVSSNSYEPEDNSDTLRDMAAAYLRQQKEALKTAYETNLSDLQAEQDKLTLQYSQARDAESANDALARQRWNETAAAYGLNSGTQGQAQLAFATQKQANLSQLQQAEAAANAETERQKTLLGKQYQSALTQALEANNYQLFQQLYSEAVRLDQALQNQQQYDASIALRQYQSALDQYNADRSFNYQKEVNSWQQNFQQQQLQQQISQQQWQQQFQQRQQTYQQQLQEQQFLQELEKWQYRQNQDSQETALASAALLASGGDYSAYGEIYGWDQATVDRMNALWQAQQAAAASSSGGKSSGGSSRSGGGSGRSGGKSSGGSEETDSMYSEALTWVMENGGDPVQYLTSRYGLSQAEAELGWSMYQAKTSSSSGLSSTGFQQFISVVSSNLRSGAKSGALSLVKENWGKLTSDQQRATLSMLSQQYAATTS